MVCTDHQVGPAAFWITNPNNTFVGNMAVDIGKIGYGGGGVGYWIISGGDRERETGADYLSTDYWSAKYATQHAGAVFNPSNAVFGADPAVPRWVMAQQQARTPLRHFAGNGVRSSHRGVHIDGFITSSVPGELSGADPEAVYAFAPLYRDGTCIFFPAANGGKGAGLPSGEGVRPYAPVLFEYAVNQSSSDGRVEATRFRPTVSRMEGLHVSRCGDAWWSRAARLNISGALFAHNWVGMTNHKPQQRHWCPGDGNGTNPGLANIAHALFIGYGDTGVNARLCATAGLV